MSFSYSFLCSSDIVACVLLQIKECMVYFVNMKNYRLAMFGKMFLSSSDQYYHIIGCGSEFLVVPACLYPRRLVSSPVWQGSHWTNQLQWVYWHLFCGYVFMSLWEHAKVWFALECKPLRVWYTSLSSWVIKYLQGAKMQMSGSLCPETTEQLHKDTSSENTRVS